MATRMLKSARKQLGLFAMSAVLSTAMVGSFGLSPAAANEAVIVYKDQAKVFRISRPASTIIVGNPQLLAATVQDLQTIVLTGKQYGTTNMIVLDDAGEPILDEMVVVGQNENSMVRVYSGAQVSTLSCSAGACQAASQD